MNSNDSSFAEPFIFSTIDDSFVSENEKWKDYTIHQKFLKMRTKLFRPITKGSMRGSIFCLLTLYFGSGMLTLPYSVKECGVCWATIVFAMAVFSLYLTLEILCEIAYDNHMVDYNNLISMKLGKKVAEFSSLINILSNFGVIIAYMQITSNFLISYLDYFSLQDLVPLTPYWTRFFQMNIICFLVFVPMSLVKDTRVLYIFSILGTTSFLLIVFDNIIEFPLYFQQNYAWEKIKFFDFSSSFDMIFCMFLFPLGNHAAVLGVVNDLKNPNPYKGEKVVRYAFNISYFTCFFIMMIGYFSTFDQTNEIFIDRPDQSALLVIAKSFFMISVVISIGTFYYITQPSIKYYIYGKSEISPLMETIICILSFLIMNSVAFFFTSTSTIMSLIGATAVIYQCFIIPIMLYLKEEKYSDSSKKAYIALLIFTCAIGLTNVLRTIYSAVV